MAFHSLIMRPVSVPGIEFLLSWAPLTFSLEEDLSIRELLPDYPGLLAVHVPWVE